MARVHVFEFEDQPWFPGLIREYMTDFLSHMGGWSKRPYAPFTERLAEVMRRTGDERIVDLCSGGGGPALQIAEAVSAKLLRPVALVLTDLYPSPARFAGVSQRYPGSVQFEGRPVDATAVPADLHGFRLICNGFHHLEPAQARACLLDALRQRRGVAIVELTQRSLLSMLQICFGISALFAVTPFIRPFRWSRLLLTYALPIVPVCTLWDGLVSCLRVYAPGELRALVASLPANDYSWDVGRIPIPGLPSQLTYLIGSPKS